IRPSPSTMWVCGEIGYAQITSGRQRATASATAAEPSTCLSMLVLPMPCFDEIVSGGGGGDIRVGDARAETFPDCRADRVERNPSGRRRQRTEQRGVRQRLADIRERKLGRRHRGHCSACREILESELGDRAGSIDQHETVRREAAKDIHLVQQGRILDDDRVRREDGLAQANGFVVEPAKRDDGRAGALRTEARKRLRVPSLAKSGDRQQLGRGYDALASSAVKTYLVHLRSALRRVSSRRPRLAHRRIPRPSQATRFPPLRRMKPN